jgi:hypothetical protein
MRHAAQADDIFRTALERSELEPFRMLGNMDYPPFFGPNFAKLAPTSQNSVIHSDSGKPDENASTFFRSSIEGRKLGLARWGEFL